MLIGMYGVAGAQAFFGRSQPKPEDERYAENRAKPVYIEPLGLFSPKKGTSRLDLLYKISYDFFVFVKDSSERPEHAYIAQCDVAFEVLDTLGRSVTRDLSQKTIGSDEAPKAGEKKSVNGIVSFTLPAGTYTLVVDVKDKNSDRRYFDKSQQVALSPRPSAGATFSNILFIDTDERKRDTSIYPPLLYGGDAPFGKSFDCFLEVATPGTSAPVLTYTLRRTEADEAGESYAPPESTNTLRGSFVSRAGAVVWNKTLSAYKQDSSSADGVYSALIGIRGDSLDLGNYLLTVRSQSDGRVDSVQKRFRVRWIGMPKSLLTPNIAVQSMEVVLSDSDFQKLNSGSSGDKMKKVEAYWKAHDPTPSTPYNEAMAEFYRRVDYANTAFSAMNDMNGYRTDRGRVYINSGPPSTTERDFSPTSAPREIWLYPRLHKRFVFTDDRRKGDYALTAIETTP
jgi:GWxTD domain-containing protein